MAKSQPSTRRKPHFAFRGFCGAFSSANTGCEHAGNRRKNFCCIPHSRDYSLPGRESVCKSFSRVAIGSNLREQQLSPHRLTYCVRRRPGSTRPFDHALSILAKLVLVTS